MPVQIFYSLSERHTLLDGKTVDINYGHQFHSCLSEALSMVVEHVARLPRLHQAQISCRDTALLMVGPCFTWCSPGSGSTCMGVFANMEPLL